MNKIKNNILFACAAVLLHLLFCSGAAAQNGGPVRGNVKDSKGEPVIGAVVMLEGSTSVASVTDIDGNYLLNIPSSAAKPRLTVSCMGYASQSVDVAGRAVIDFVLADDAELIEEAVVVGYGSMRRSDLTGSVASIKIDEDEAGQNASFDKLLQGRAAGVQVVSNSGAPDGGVSIRVRGLSSFNGSSEPLYVVDGVIISTDTGMNLFTKGQDNTGSDEDTNGLMGINPQDIESMEILKDASATAIYGSQGANGVVLITTKTAKRDRPQVRFGAGMDVSRRYKKMDMLSFDGYIEFLEAQSPNNSAFNTIYEDRANGILKVEPIDWQDHVLRTAVSQRYYLQISGRPKGTSYLFSFNYNDTKGIVKSTGFTNYTFRLNLDKTLSKNFRIGTKSAVSYLDSHLTQGATTGRLNAASSLMRSMITSRPYRTIPGVTNPIGYEEEEEEGEEDDDGSVTFRSGPDKWLTDFVNEKQEIRLNPNIYAQYNFSKELYFRSTLGADYRSTEQGKWKSSRINTTTEGSIGAIGHTDRLNFNFDNTLNFNKKFGGKHTVTGMLGMSVSQSEVTIQTVEGWNITQLKAQLDAINSAPNTRFTYAESRSSLMSYFVRGIYNYRDRYTVTATYRFDGSSKFQKANKWSSFPSFAAAWRINQEPWFKVPVVSMAKLRLGWGQVGNQAITNYRTLSNYSNTTYPDHSADNEAQMSVGVYPSNIANPNLRWETSEQYNAGLDFGMWKGRLTFTVDVYDKTTKDLLQSKTIAGSSGFSSLWVNMGSIGNRGLEFSVDAVPVKSRGFEWSIGGNISFNRNRVIKIADDNSEGDYIYMSADSEAEFRNYFLGSSIGTGSIMHGPLNIFIEGEPMGLFYGMKTDGLVQEGETGVPLSEGAEPTLPGAVKYVDVDGDFVITSRDRVIIGNPNPDFTFGFNTSLSWKKFTLSAAFAGSWGNDIYNVNLMRDSDVSNYNTNVLKDAFYKAWTPENPNTKYPALNRYSSADTYWACDRFVEDGSYIRLSNLSLSYKIDFKKKAVKQISLGLSASNLWFWTRYSGWDPDVNSYGTVWRMGADMGSYPGARTMRFDLRFLF